MGERGDEERDIAAQEREQAAMLRAVAAHTADPAAREQLEQQARDSEDDALLHDRKADVYDREDDAV